MAITSGCRAGLLRFFWTGVEFILRHLHIFVVFFFFVTSNAYFPHFLKIYTFKTNEVGNAKKCFPVYYCFSPHIFVCLLRVASETRRENNFELLEKESIFILVFQVDHVVGISNASFGHEIAKFKHSRAGQPPPYVYSPRQTPWSATSH